MDTLWINREYSWLDFNNRVLNLADRKDIPLYERLRFFTIANDNLDEFYMIRVGGLNEQFLLNKLSNPKDTKLIKEQLSIIAKKVAQHQQQANRIHHDLINDLKNYSVFLLKYQECTNQEIEYLQQRLLKQIKPYLTFHFVSENHPFPQLLNKETYCFAKVIKQDNEFLVMAHLNYQFIPQWIEIPRDHGMYLILVEQLILQTLDILLKDYTIVEKSLIKITRNADLDLDFAMDEEMDYRKTMQQILANRNKLEPVRLEMSHTASSIKNIINKSIPFLNQHTFKRKSPFSFGYVDAIHTFLSKYHPETFYAKYSPNITPYLDPGQDIFQQILNHDVYLHAPYDDFDSILDLFEAASTSLLVKSIKITLYRVADQSKIIEILKKAANNNIEVVVVIELKARFDEESNIEWSSELEKAGCKVVFGFSGYKVHAKIGCITLVKNNKTHYITHLGTGNYNEVTAKQYTDISLLTSDKKIGEDAQLLFTLLENGEIELLQTQTYQHLWVAPEYFKNNMLDFIDQEIVFHQQHNNGHIILKMNSLTDKDIIQKLINAASVGVTIDLIIRGINCLLPQENIQIMSVIGRYLEHTRCYYFFHNQQEKVMIASADLMTRNTEKRIEVGTFIEDPIIKQDLIYMLKTMMIPTKNMWILTKNGVYKHQANTNQLLENQELLQNKTHYLIKTLQKENWFKRLISLLTSK